MLHRVLSSAQFVYVLNIEYVCLIVISFNRVSFLVCSGSSFEPSVDYSTDESVSLGGCAEAQLVLLSYCFWIAN